MLTKDVCLMFKSLLALVHSSHYQMTNLYLMLGAVAGEALSDEARTAYEQASEHIKANLEGVDRVLDEIMKQGADPEQAVAKLSTIVH